MFCTVICTCNARWSNADNLSFRSTAFVPISFDYDTAHYYKQFTNIYFFSNNVMNKYFRCFSLFITMTPQSNVSLLQYYTICKFSNHISNISHTCNIIIKIYHLSCRRYHIEEILTHTYAWGSKYQSNNAFYQLYIKMYGDNKTTLDSCLQAYHYTRILYTIQIYFYVYSKNVTVSM